MEGFCCLGITKEEELREFLDDRGIFGDGSKNSLKLRFIHRRRLSKLNPNKPKIQIAIRF